MVLNFDALDEVLEGTFRANLQRLRQSASQPVRDLDSVCSFLGSPPALTFFDAPWAPVFTGAIFLIHPWLGWLAVFAALAILVLALLTEWSTRGPYRSASEYSVSSQRFAEETLRNADVLEAMGMFESFRRRWRDRHDRAVAFQARRRRAAGRVAVRLESVASRGTGRRAGLGSVAGAAAGDHARHDDRRFNHPGPGAGA